MTADWTIADARRSYSVPHWSEGYFDVDGAGRAVAQPLGAGGPSVAFPEVIAAARRQGLRIPLLLRFPQVLGHRLRRLQAAFEQEMAARHYDGGYTAIYPIKVNQQRDVVAELVRSGDGGFGLEAGSKPELMTVLAMSRGGTVVCNGYKDREYIRLALIGRKLGLEVYIVIEKASELQLVIEEARRLDVQPLLGVRMRLVSIGAGMWQNTGGDKAKFGLMPRQALELSDALKQAGYGDALKLLHFHMGSQISNVRDIANGMREAVRYFVELSKLGHGITHVDVGGGLGVDYEGTRSRSFCSINYGLSQYAHSIVAPLAEACVEHALPHPRVLTESGRALTAHHAVLVSDVTAVERMPEGNPAAGAHAQSSALKHLHELYGELDRRPLLEVYHEAQHHQQEGQTLFALGAMSLAERAALDDVYYAIVHAIHARLRHDGRGQQQALDELTEKLADKYFVNLSVFQSMPDVWALEQIFPIMPLAGLHARPTRRAVLEDLTCDSDGRIDHYVDEERVHTTLALHAPGSEPYHLGVFMVGAYQETLGDIHNLFGDTDCVCVRLADGGFELESARQGDTTDELLRYVGYDIDHLRMAYRAKIAAAGLDPADAKRVAEALEAGLVGYTYLHDE
ncbi:MAG: biosynthetic arginine decarboxylase [Xanthomonadales bacterium]|nr:Biosynthetic arginine decarboxylase [Xanthomonadales bacterium]MCC6592460.1 biosynthetic arginine decarboxylase [Xanthomonadales bacterium]